MVTIEEFRNELWGDQIVGWRASLHQCVRDLRRALADDARSPSFVATVSRMGYRFVGERMPQVEPRTIRGLLRRPSVAYAAGIATAVLLPASLLVLCIVFIC